MVRGGDGRQVFDWVLDRNARRASGLALVMVVALLGSWLAVEAVVRWRESERSVERARLFRRLARTARRSRPCGRTAACRGTRP